MMKNELEEIIQQYRDVTLDLIEEINKDNDELQSFVDKRQELIENMMTIEYTKAEFAQLMEECDVLSLEEKLKGIMQSKKDEIKNIMSQISKSKNANMNYNKRFIGSSVYFNKKI